MSTQANTIGSIAKFFYYADKLRQNLIPKQTTKYRNEDDDGADTMHDQQFAAPGAFKELDCKGRPCASCGNCRDWYFTGDSATWE
ncbi:unnamed protein product [Rotaria sp. Silwood2]|nr:unnamed protein product [Rotaria sp. Silwood2]